MFSREGQPNDTGRGPKTKLLSPRMGKRANLSDCRTTL